MRASQFKSRQRGISFIGLLFVAVVLACVGVVAAQVVPDADRVPGDRSRPRNKAKEGTTVPEVRAIFDRAAGHRRLQVDHRQGPRRAEGRRQGRGVVCLRQGNPPVRPGLPAAEVQGPVALSAIVRPAWMARLAALQARLQHRFSDARCCAGADAPQFLGRPQRAARIPGRLGAEPRRCRTCCTSAWRTCPKATSRACAPTWSSRTRCTSWRSSSALSAAAAARRGRGALGRRRTGPRSWPTRWRP